VSPVGVGCDVEQSDERDRRRNFLAQHPADEDGDEDEDEDGAPGSIRALEGDESLDGGHRRRAVVP